jgi:putative lipoic acid-binding regulatory protein
LDAPEAPEGVDAVFGFPCRFPIKAMGPADMAFEDLVVEIVGRHVRDLDRERAVSVRASSGGRWLAVTVVVEAHSRAQLDAIYRELTAHEAVKWAL